MGKKTTKVHVCTPNSLSTVQLPSMMSLSRTRDQGVDPMRTTSSTVDLTDTRATAGSHISSAEDEAYTTARVRTAETSSMFLTASEGKLTGNPCASSTRKKDNKNGELSMQATRGSRDDSPAPGEGEEVISLEQLRFTAAISKAMSKELAPLLAGRDPTQARPSVYRGSKEGSIDGWILVMRRYLQRTQAKATPDDRAWSIIGHLEGEAHNYIINKADSERDTPEKVFELLASRFGTGGTVSKCAKPLPLNSNPTGKTGCSTWTRWRGCEARVFLTSPLPPSVTRSCSASSKVFVILSCEENFPSSMHPRLPSPNLLPWNHCDLRLVNCSAPDPSLHHTTPGMQ